MALEHFALWLGQLAFCSGESLALAGAAGPAHNGALNLFCLVVAVDPAGFPLVGRLWCSSASWSGGKSVNAWREPSVGNPLKAPRGDGRLGLPSAGGGFALILLWEEVWNLQNTAWLSSCLLLLITAGAVIGSLRFEKRFFGAAVSVPLAA